MKLNCISIFSLIHHLQSWDFRVCAVFVLDSVYMVDSAKFLSGSLAALATMVQLEVCCFSFVLQWLCSLLALRELHCDFIFELEAVNFMVMVKIVLLGIWISTNTIGINQLGSFWQVPHINVLMKMDLLNNAAKEQLEMFLEPEIHELLSSEHSMSRFNKKWVFIICLSHEYLIPSSPAFDPNLHCLDETLQSFFKNLVTSTLSIK